MEKKGDLSMDAEQKYEMWLGSDQVTSTQRKSLSVSEIMQKRLRTDSIQIWNLEQADFEA